MVVLGLKCKLKSATMQCLRLQYFGWAPRERTIRQSMYAARSSDCSHFLWGAAMELAVLTWRLRHTDVLRPQMCLCRCQLWHYFLSASSTLAPSVPKPAPSPSPGSTRGYGCITLQFGILQNKTGSVEYFSTVRPPPAGCPLVVRKVIPTTEQQRRNKYDFFSNKERS